MANYADIKATIDANIKQNNNQAITGVVLNAVLNGMVNSLGDGYQFKGVAATTTNPGTPDQKVFYLGGKGTYSYFGQPTIQPGNLGVFWYDSSWHYEAIDVAPVIEIVNNFTDGGSTKALSAQMGKDLYDALFGEIEVIATKDDATIYVVKNGVEANPGNRLRCVLPISAGQYTEASCSMGQGVAASIYESVAKCIVASTDYLQTFSFSYVASISGRANVDGYLCVSLAKVGGADFSSADITAFVNALQWQITSNQANGAINLINAAIDSLDGRVEDLEEEIAEIKSNQEILDLGTLVQKSLTSSDLSDNYAERRVSMLSKIAIPYQGMKLTFHLPDYICVGIRSGDTAGNLNNNDFFYFNGQSFTFAANSKYFRLCFAKSLYPDHYESQQEAAIPLATIQAYIANGEIKVFCSTEAEPDIIKRNYDAEKNVKAVMRKFISGATQNYSLTKYPVFGHISDIHGDMWRAKSFLRYCDFLGLDAALISGDSVSSLPSDSMVYIDDLAQKCATPVIPCLGNHDVQNLYTAASQSAMIKPSIDRVAGVSPATNPTYYYKDIASKNIRIICLNQYEWEHSQDGGSFTKAQCDWLIASLLSTPANYGVLIMMHSPETTIDMDADHTAFYQKIRNYWGTPPSITGNPIAQVVDAFIGGVSATISYTSKGSSITTTADFTTKNAGVEFIAYINGHEHIDLVGYVNGTTHLQLNLNVCCGIAVYGTSYHYLANNSDLPRGWFGSTQDAFNVYCIDRTAKVVRIARVGSNLSGYDLQERKFMAIPYAE